MNYASPNLRRVLAAEYVLGTLTGAARRRFERLCAAAGGAELATERRFWEQRLAMLDHELKPVSPPETVWIGLERRIGSDAGQRGANDAGKAVPLRPSPVAVPRRSKFLQGWALLATAASIVLAVLLVRVYQRPPVTVVQQQAAAPLPYVAALNLPKAPMHFTLALSPERGTMAVAASGSYPKLGAHSLELWWISPKGPVALGVLPTHGEGHMKLPRGLPVQGQMTLAISLEPVGGSPTGQPTGPVLVSGTALRSI